MAPHQKRAKERGARLVLIDESGCMMAPLVRRTLAPSGQTPVLKTKGTHRDRVSLAAALCVSPKQRRVSLKFRTYPAKFVNSAEAANFLRQVLRSTRGPLIVVWDNGSPHRGPDVRELLQRTKRLELRNFPPYAPELNPVEAVWNYLKYDQFANHAPLNVSTLDEAVTQCLTNLQTNQPRLQRILAAGVPFG